MRNKKGLGVWGNGFIRDGGTPKGDWHNVSITNSRGERKGFVLRYTAMRHKQ
jgi:hypothetical protein